MSFLHARDEALLALGGQLLAGQIHGLLTDLATGHGFDGCHNRLFAQGAGAQLLEYLSFSQPSALDPTRLSLPILCAALHRQGHWIRIRSPPSQPPAYAGYRRRYAPKPKLFHGATVAPACRSLGFRFKGTDSYKDPGAFKGRETGGGSSLREAVNASVTDGWALSVRLHPLGSLRLALATKCASGPCPRPFQAQPGARSRPGPPACVGCRPCRSFPWTDLVRSGW